MEREIAVVLFAALAQVAAEGSHLLARGPQEAGVAQAFDGAEAIHERNLTAPGGRNGAWQRRRVLSRMAR